MGGGAPVKCQVASRPSKLSPPRGQVPGNLLSSPLRGHGVMWTAGVWGTEHELWFTPLRVRTLAHNMGTETSQQSAVSAEVTSLPGAAWGLSPC